MLRIQWKVRGRKMSRDCAGDAGPDWIGEEWEMQ